MCPSRTAIKADLGRYIQNIRLLQCTSETSVQSIVLFDENLTEQKPANGLQVIIKRPVYSVQIKHNLELILQSTGPMFTSKSIQRILMKFRIGWGHTESC